MTIPLLSGNQINFLNWYNGETNAVMPKMWCYQAIGYAEVTSTLQTSIPIYVPSNLGSGTDNTRYPDKLLTVPAGMVLYYLGLRIPPPTPGQSPTPASGSVPTTTGGNTTLIGTTGERLKVGTAHTDTAPVITCASNAYVPGIAKLAPTQAMWGTLAAPLGVLGSDTTYNLLVSNAGNTAAGTGIRTAANKVRLIVDVAYIYVNDPALPERLRL